jgi:putative transcriptional regulator
MTTRTTPQTATEENSTDATSLKGSLLIAMPALQDPNFRRLVTLLISHNEQGALGIVLGAVTATPIRDVCAQFGVTWSRPSPSFVRSGGPCEGGRIWLMHGGPAPLPDAVTVTPGIHIGSSPQLLRTLAEHPDAAIPVMVFGGYAGWGPGQLEAELQQKSWLPSFGDIDADLVFATAPDKVWEAALAAMALSPGHIVSGSGASA